MRGKRKVPISHYPKLKPERAGNPAGLTPLEYEVAIWVGRGADLDEISGRLDIPKRMARELLKSVMRYTSCASVAEVEQMFEPDWDRLDASLLPDPSDAWRGKYSVLPPRGRRR